MRDHASEVLKLILMFTLLPLYNIFPRSKGPCTYIYAIYFLLSVAFQWVLLKVLCTMSPVDGLSYFILRWMGSFDLIQTLPNKEIASLSTLTIFVSTTFFL